LAWLTGWLAGGEEEGVLTCRSMCFGSLFAVFSHFILFLLRLEINNAGRAWTSA
jgi:hypothetical protein